MTIEQYMNMLSERVIDNSRQLRREKHQRRNGMEDLYGVCFSANGDKSHPAEFYISLSPDYVYLQRFAFKFVIKPYVSSVSGVSGSDLTIGSTSLALDIDSSHEVISGTSTLDDDISGSVTPNPHTHSASGGIDSIEYGVTEITTSSSDWKIEISGIDITPYLLEQQDMDDDEPLFSGEGIYPSKSLAEDVDNFYDILDVASTLYAEGNDDDAYELIKPEFKKVQIYSDAPFGVDAYMYLKYSSVNR